MQLAQCRTLLQYGRQLIKKIQIRAESTSEFNSARLSQPQIALAVCALDEREEKRNGSLRQLRSKAKHRDFLTIELYAEAASRLNTGKAPHEIGLALKKGRRSHASATGIAALIPPLILSPVSLPFKTGLLVVVITGSVAGSSAQRSNKLMYCYCQASPLMEPISPNLTTSSEEISLEVKLAWVLRTTCVVHAWPKNRSMEVQHGTDKLLIYSSIRSLRIRSRHCGGDR